MWRVTIKGLLAHKLRLALTALSIVLGVTFIAGTFVLTDTLNKTFDTLFSNVYQNIDFQVRGVAQFGSGGTATRNTHPRVARGHGAGRAGRGGRRGLGDGHRPVRRARRQGHRERWRPHPRALLRPRPADLRPPPGPGRAADDTERRRHGPRDGAEVRLQGRPARQDPAARVPPRRSPSRASRASGRPTTWPGRRWPPSTPRPRSASSATWVSSTTSTSSPNRVRTRRPCSATSRGCCHAASRW